MKNKLFSIFLLLILSLTLSSCKSDNDDPIIIDDDPVIIDMSWKIEYDMVDASPYFSDEVTSCYQIFPISFADSNNDGYGDINGITENITYLSDTLGIDCIWINPITLSPTYHKYDVVNYYEIDPLFGTMDDYVNLLDIAEENNIKVLMDLVINHTASSNPWFLDSESSLDSEYRDWYMWSDLTDRAAYPSKSGWSYSNGYFYYASFWSEMPELNFDNEDVRTELKNIAEFWLNKGVDGFRIDAAKHIYDVNEYPRGTNLLDENTIWFLEFNDFIKGINPDSFMVGEIASDSSNYVDNYFEGMDSTFNFSFASDLIYALQAGYNSMTIEGLVEAREYYSLVREDYIDSIFLTNHDQERIYDKLGYSIDKTKLAAQILFTLPGVSWIYYGEEIGMSGINPHESIRQPFKWSLDSPYNTEGHYQGISSWDSRNLVLDGVDEQLLDPDSLLNVYIEMIELKNTQDALANGDLKLITNDENALMSYIRFTDNQILLVVNNISAVERTVTTNMGTYTEIYSSGYYTEDGTEITFGPYSTTIFEIDILDIIFNK